VNNRCFLVLGAAAAFALSVPVAAPAADMGLSTMDCSQSTAMMMKPMDMSSMPAMPASATTDDAFMGMSHAMMQHATMMAGMELKCGKDAKAKAAAAKLLQQLNDDGIMEAKDILNTYNH
jgi:uncharacterized protein involved in copper resistance